MDRHGFSVLRSRVPRRQNAFAMSKAASSIATILAAAAILLVPPAHAAGDNDYKDQRNSTWIVSQPKTPFDSLANQLLDGLQAAAPAKSIFKTAKGPKLAFNPFNADDIPVSPHLARELNNRLLASIQAKAKQFRIMSHAEVGTLMKELEEVSVFDVEDPVASFVKHQKKLVRSIKPDILVMGTIRNDGTNILLSYKAAWLSTGEIVASTSPVSVAKASKTTVAQLSLKQVTKKAAGYFRQHASDMKELRLGTVRYKNLGGQPELGSYILDTMSSALQTSFADVLTERKLIVRQAVLDQNQINQVVSRGLGLKKDGIRTSKPETFSKKPGVYVLSGSYWRLHRAFEVRFKLRDAKGRSVSFAHTIAATSVPQDLQVEPDPPVIAFVKKTSSSSDLRLSSDRGSNPVYHLGENFNFVVELANDAWLYCFYLNAENKLIKIFPNWRQPDTHLRGPEIYTIPGGKLFHFTLRVRKPLGMEALKCFAAGSDLADKLPASVKGMDFTPLPEHMIYDLSASMRRYANGDISEAAIVVTVEK
jgi:hypothetical protein